MNDDDDDEKAGVGRIMLLLHPTSRLRLAKVTRLWNSGTQKRELFISSVIHSHEADVQRR